MTIKTSASAETTADAYDDKITYQNCQSNIDDEVLLWTIFSEAEGYRFGQENRGGIIILTFDTPLDSAMEKIAFGFMTWHSNGTIVRVESGITSDYIECKLVRSLHKF